MSGIEARRAHLAEVYSAELRHLRDMGITARIVFTAESSADCAAIEADTDGRRILVTNTDADLIEDAADTDGALWYVAIFDIDDAEGDEQVAEGEHENFAAAWNAALESLERGDFVA